MPNMNHESRSNQGNDTMTETTLRNALVYDRTTHPERTNATYERVVEVLENILGDDANTLLVKLEAALGDITTRSELTAAQADTIVETVDAFGLEEKQYEQLVDQLMAAEMATAEAVEIHKQYKIPISHLERDIVPVIGNGCWIVDTKGRSYLDMDSNYSATNLGMANPEVAKGLFNQATTLISMKEDRVQIARTRFLKEIHQMMPEGLNYFYWQNSGGEAVDKAIKIAKAYIGDTDVIAFDHGFHGRTHGAVAVTWNEAYRKPFGLEDEDWVHFAPFNDVEAVKELMDETGAKIVILEMVQGEEAGNRAAEQAFVDALWKEVHDRGGVIIDDEVQAGFGRTAVNPGDWFACMSYNVVPDIMVIGKSFGGGYPVTAVVTTQPVSDAMQYGWDGSTFGGNPMAATAALIATRQMREMKVTENVIARSKQFEEGLNALQKKHSVIGEVRARGLMIAIQLGSSEMVEAVQAALARKGVKTSLSTGEYLRLLPPTIISEEEVDYFLDRFDQTLQELE